MRTIDLRSSDPRRRGATLLMVMVTLSTCLVLTYALLQGQGTTSLIEHNVSHVALAHEAAHAGAAVAVKEVSNLSWTGVGSPYQRTIYADSLGSARFEVSYEAVAGTSPAAAILMRVRSTGIWESSDATRRIERDVVVDLELRPRNPGRQSSALDWSDASDVDIPPSGFELHLDASTLTSSLDVGPTTRFEGEATVQWAPDFMPNVGWSNTVRNAAFSSIFTEYSNAGALVYSHPVIGSLDLESSPLDPTALNLLGVNWQSGTMHPSLPAIDFGKWLNYELFEGGFTYNATLITSPISNVTLGPSPSNPLGIFYCAGPLDIGNDVTVQGTIVSNGLLRVTGQRVFVAAYGWRNYSGGVVSGYQLWPRLPALVGQNITFTSPCQSYVIGAVVADNTITVEPRDHALAAGSVNFVGTATASRRLQPISRVKLVESQDLTPLVGSTTDAIWLESSSGGSGRWHPIVDVNVSKKTIDVVGELSVNPAVAYRVAPLRLQYVDIDGPLIADSVVAHGAPAWTSLTSTQWDQLHSDWQANNAALSAMGDPTLEFVEWLADPANFAGWPEPYATHALTLEPTFDVRSHSVPRQWQPPLYAPFDGTVPTPGGGSPPADPTVHYGYRWEVQSWRDVL